MAKAIKQPDKTSQLSNRGAEAADVESADVIDAGAAPAAQTVDQQHASGETDGGNNGGSPSSALLAAIAAMSGEAKQSAVPTGISPSSHIDGGEAPRGA